MKALITGATGLVRKQLIAVLLHNGISVHYLTTSLKKIENKTNCYGFFWNPLEGKIDENCLIGVDAIIHLAGANIANRWTNSYKQEIIESRILSSNLLFNALKKYPNQVRQIISASGTAIYPDSFTAIYNEKNAEIAKGFLSNVVVKWEKSVDEFKLLNIKVAIVRTGIVYAKEGGALPEMVKPIRMGFGANFGNGKQIQSWIHITDLVNIYYFILKKELDGIYNAVAPEKITNEKQTKLIAEIIKKPLFLPNIPRFIMEIVLGKMCELLFTNKNISSQKIIDSGFEFQFPDVKSALQNSLE